MKEDIELLAIGGLDGAVVGSAMTNGEEVLVYDYDKCVEIIIGAGCDIAYAENYVLALSQATTKGVPLFVHFDNSLEYYGEPPSVGAATVH